MLMLFVRLITYSLCGILMAYLSQTLLSRLWLPILGASRAPWIAKKAFHKVLWGWYCSNSCFHWDMQARMRVHRLSLSSQENYESSIDDYINKTISTLSARRWRSLLELWGKGKCQTSGTGALVGTSTTVRRKLYIPPSSSPAKE